MRPFLLTVATGTSLGLSLLTTSPGNSMTIAAPMGLRPAVQALALTEAVHCRRYPHWHAKGHRWGRGCTLDVGDEPPRSGVARASVRGSTGLGVRSSTGVGSTTGLPRTSAPAGVARQPGNFLNPSNPQDRSGASNRQDMTQPRSMNPQDMR
jgi:hypothetical protein